MEIEDEENKKIDEENKKIDEYNSKVDKYYVFLSLLIIHIFNS